MLKPNSATGLDRLSLTGSLRIIQAADADGSKIKPGFDMDAYNGGLMRLAWWPHPVVVDLAGVALAAARLPVYLTHDETPENLVGQTEAVEVGSGRITAAGPLTASRDSSRSYGQLLDHAAAGYQWQCSIGASVQRYEFCDAGKEIVVNGRAFPGPCYIARKITLSHVAIVPLGADTSTKAAIAAQNQSAHAGREKTIMMTFDQWIQAQGLVSADLSEAKRTSLQAAYDSLKSADALPPAPAASPPVAAAAAVATTVAASAEADDVQALRIRLAAEHERIAAVEKIAANHPTICAQAIKEGWTAEKTELAVCRADRGPTSSGPAIHGGGETASSGPAIEAALCLTGRMAQPERFYQPQVLEAAAKLGRISIQEAIMLAASANGWRGRITSSAYRANHKALLGAAFGVNIAAGFSAVDIAGILSNVANKFLLASFNAVEQAWRFISRVNPASDFKTMTRYRLTSGGDYAKVGPGGELKHGTLGEESYTNKAETYGKMLALTRQDQYNDDLGALTQAPALLGGDAGRKLNQIFWAVFQDNAAFFSSGNKNLIGSTGRPWYLLAEPGELPVMEVCFLDGRDTPVIESAEADFNTLGIQMRSYHDWGCAKAEYRAGIMSHTALSLDALQAGLKLFRDQTFNGTDPVALKPAILLVASGDEVTGGKLFKDALIQDTTANSKIPTGNAFQGMFRPVVSAYLANS